MKKEMLINCLQQEEIRIAIIENSETEIRKMIALPCSTAAPVGQQAPPARAAASAMGHAASRAGPSC